jgi:hypothetical protein
MGLGAEPTVQCWASGVSGLRRNERWNTEGFPCATAGLVPDFNPRKHLPDRKAVKLMSRESQLAVFAAVEAAGGVDLPARLGLEATQVGAFAAAGYEVSSLGDSEAMLAACADPEDPGRILLQRLFGAARDVYNPLSPLKILPNMPLFHAGLSLGLQGPHLCLGSSPAAGLAALGEASESLARGECSLALVLGSDAQVEEFRAQLLVEAGVSPTLAPSEGAAALILGTDAGSPNSETSRSGPRIVAWDAAQEPCTGYGHCGDGGKTRRALYSRVLEHVGSVDLCFADLWGHPDHDGPERFALGNQSAIEGPLQSNRARLGWLGAAQGLTDVAIAWSLITSGDVQRALVTSVGLAGDIAAVVLEGQS